MNKRKKEEEYDKKIYIAFYISRKDLARLDNIIKQGDSIFEDRSTLIRHLIKQQLPKIEREIEEDRKKEAEEENFIDKITR